MAGTSAERSLNAVTARSGRNAFVRRVDQAELVAQDPVVVERRDRVEVGEDRFPQRGLRVRIAAMPRVELELEVRHQLRRDAGVGRQDVVLVRLREARPDSLAVHAVGAQHADLAPVESGQHHQAVERVGLRVAATDGGDAVGQALPDGA
jgi:hypothetical protein